MAKKTSDWKMEKSQRLEMRVAADFLKSLDGWRRNQPDLPGRAEAIRRLVELGIKASKAK